MNNWQALRSHYKHSFEEMAQYHNEGALFQYDPYGVEFNFTPIERLVDGKRKLYITKQPQLF